MIGIKRAIFPTKLTHRNKSNKENPLKNILFIGTYLSDRKGTKSIPEKLRSVLLNSMKISLKSSVENKILRLLDICAAIFFAPYTKIHFDVFSGPAFIMTEIGSMLATWRKKPVLLTLRGGRLAEFSVNNSNRIKKVFARAQYIQTPSLFLKKHFEKLGFTIHYLPNGLDIESFVYKRDQVKQYSLLWVRAFTPIYNPELAIKTLYEVLKEYPNATLTMIGPDSGTLAEVKELINSLNIANAISITGPVPNSQLFTYYQTHSVYLNTTSYESFGVALIEAAACGSPIVSTNVGEIPYLWSHNENMLLVEDFEAVSFAKQVGRLFGNKALAQRISMNARKRAEEFDWEHIKPQWIQLLS